MEYLGTEHKKEKTLEEKYNICVKYLEDGAYGMGLQSKHVDKIHVPELIDIDTLDEKGLAKKLAVHIDSGKSFVFEFSEVKGMYVIPSRSIRDIGITENKD